MSSRITEKNDGAGDIASALHEYTAQAAAPPPARIDTGRAYRLREVTIVLAIFALMVGVFDSEGLLTWARRMDVSRARAVWLRILGPLHSFDAALGLDVPRRALNVAADHWGRLVSESEDPLFEQAWRSQPATTDAPPITESDTDTSVTEPAAPVEAAPEPPPPAMATASGAAPMTVLLMGDSLLAGSLSSAIVRTLATDSRFRVVRATQSATGLSRPEVFDWMSVVPGLLEREHPLFVICSFGANDAVAIAHGDELLDFGAPKWKMAYRARVRQMMTALAGNKTQVLWLGLPPMRDKRLGERASSLNRIFAATARTVPRVEYLELGMLISGRDGAFATFGADAAGRFVRLRLDDGVHYSPAGARLVSRWVVEWLRERYRVLGTSAR